MKAFKIKKRNERTPIYFCAEPIAFFEKPKFKNKLFLKIHPPSLYKPFNKLEITFQSPEE